MYTGDNDRQILVWSSSSKHQAVIIYLTLQ
ncbi:hypothetical protein LINPERPRIM_LOCUS14550 [Linum perenne]